MKKELFIFLYYRSESWTLGFKYKIVLIFCIISINKDYCQCYCDQIRKSEAASVKIILWYTNHLKHSWLAHRHGDRKYWCYCCQTLGADHKPCALAADVVHQTFAHTKRWFLLWKAKGPVRAELQDPCVSKHSSARLSLPVLSLQVKMQYNRKGHPAGQVRQALCSKGNSKSHSPRLPCHPLQESQIKDLCSSPRSPSSLKKEVFSDLSQWVDQDCTRANTEQKDTIETKELRSCFYIKDYQCLFFFSTYSKQDPQSTLLNTRP